MINFKELIYQYTVPAAELPNVFIQCYRYGPYSIRCSRQILFGIGKEIVVSISPDSGVRYMGKNDTMAILEHFGIIGQAINRYVGPCSDDKRRLRPLYYTQVRNVKGEVVPGVSFLESWEESGRERNRNAYSGKHSAWQCGPRRKAAI